MVDFVPLFEVHITEALPSQISIETTQDPQLDMFIEAVANTDFTLELNTNTDFSVDLDIEEFVVEIGPHQANNVGQNVVASATVDIIITAAIALGMYRAVTAVGQYCEPTQPALDRYAGVTKVAVSQGTDTSVVRAGLLTEAGWSWTPNAPIFVGDRKSVV